MGQFGLQTDPLPTIFAGLEGLPELFPGGRGILRAVDRQIGPLAEADVSLLAENGHEIELAPDHDGPLYVKTEMLLPAEGLEHDAARVRPVEIPVEIGAQLYVAPRRDAPILPDTRAVDQIGVDCLHGRPLRYRLHPSRREGDHRVDGVGGVVHEIEGIEAVVSRLMQYHHEKGLLFKAT